MKQDSIKWKLLEVISDYKVYVSNNGQIKTPSVNYKRSNGRPMNRKGKLLKQGLDQDGYYKVVFSHKNIRKTYMVHRLVAKAFLKTFNDNLQVNHKDGNKTDFSCCKLFTIFCPPVQSK